MEVFSPVEESKTITSWGAGVKSSQTWIKQLKDLKLETPFTVLDTEVAKYNTQHLNKLLPDVDLYYAIKSNSDPRLISAIRDQVKGFEVASRGELALLRSLGIESKQILFSNPVKVPSHLSFARREGVQNYAFDSSDEIEKISRHVPGANVYLRIKVTDIGSRFPLSKKFGIDPGQAVDFIKSATVAGLHPVGLAFHVGSQSERPESWKAAFKTAGMLIGELSTKHKIFLSLLNIGGGFPGPCEYKPVDITPITRVIERSIEQYIPDYIHIVAEPGRYISATSCVIVTEIIGRETRGEEEWLFLDMGVFQGLMEPLEMPSWRYPIFTEYDDVSGQKRPFVLTGPTCDAYDTIGFNYILPDRLKTGDRLYIGATGAYTDVYKTGFNGFDPPKIFYINEEIRA